MKILLPIVTIIWGTLAIVDSAFAQNWTQTSAPNRNWAAIACSADGNRLVASSLLGAYYTSTNSGATWVSNSEPQMGSYIGSWGSIASSADGQKLVATSGTSSLWISTNSGVTWLSNNVSGVSGWKSIVSSADGRKLTAAEGVNSAGFIYTSADSGISWNQTTAPRNLWASIASSADGAKLVAVPASRNKFIYTSTNSGATWITNITSLPTSASWESVASSADGVKLVAVSSFYGGIYTSTNSGAVWTSNNMANVDWQSVASSADGSKLVAVAQGGHSPIFTSTNYGTTWTSNSNPNGFWQSVVSSADGTKLAAIFFYDGDFKGGICISQSTPSPQLNLAFSTNCLALSWIVPSTNYVLQQNLDLTTPDWVTLTNTPTLNLSNLQNQVTLSPFNSNGFFRLIPQ